MIQFSKFKQYIQITDGVRFPQNSKKPFLLVYLSENSTFLTDYPKLNIRRTDVKNVIMPTTKMPRTKLLPEQRKMFKKYGLFSYTTSQKYPKGNIVFDLSNYLYVMDNTYNPKHYRQREGMLIKDILLKAFSSFPDNYQKVLIYSVDPFKDMNEFVSRKSFMILNMLKDDEFNFTDMMVCATGSESSKYRLLIKDGEYDLNRVKGILKKIRPAMTDEEIEESTTSASKKIMNHVNSIINPKNKTKTEEAIKNYLESNKDIAERIDNDEISEDEMKEIATASILYRTSGNLSKSTRIAKSIDSKRKKVALKTVDKKYADELLDRHKPTISSDNIMMQNSDISGALDNKSPEHIFQKRQIDFEKNLKNDITNSFKVLESKEVKLDIQSVKIIPKISRSGELAKTELSSVAVVLKDEFGNTHNIKIDIPNIQSDGTFTVSGRKKCLINQLVLCPITFLKEFDSKFESSYSAFHIHSKRTKRESFLDIYMASYKLSLIHILAYSFGWDRTMKRYKVGYKIVEEKPDKNIKYFTRINETQWVVFDKVNTELQRELIQGFVRHDYSEYKIKHSFPSKEYFNKMIISMTGRVNSTFLIQSNLENIVDPVVKQVLINQQLPSELELIMEYMATRVVSGYVQDRNDLSNQRIRNSEVLVHLAQKQILAAYTEYKEKVLSGNKEAIFAIPEGKVLSDFVNSEIVQDMEYANPAEEMSVKTRLTPVGSNIGGIPDKGAISIEGRNVHDSYYGNLDPLDTPEGENVGIVQHLTVDAYVTSTRGLFQTKDKAGDENSGQLSATTALIPFVEKNDGPRIMFGCNQARQSVPLKNPEPPIIQSGYESVLTNVLSDAFIKKSPVNGKVSSLTDDEMIIKDSSGKSHKIDLTPIHLRSGSGKNTLSVFKPTVTIGQVVKLGRIVAEGSSISGGSISMGRSLCVALMAYKGYNFEDGIVISDALVKREKLTSLHGIIEQVEVSSKDRIIEIAKIGDYVEKGQPLLKKTIGEVEELLGFEEGEDEDITAGQYMKKSPGGKIVDIDVYSNVGDDTFPDITELAKRTRKRNNMKDNEKFTRKGITIKGVLIEFKIEQELPIGVGDKLTNRFGAKGIVSLIEKEENMPLTPWGDRVEIITNPIGIINRMNMGQYYELYTGLISKEIARQIIKTPTKANVISLLKKTMPLIDKTKNNSFSSKLISNMQALSKGQFDKFIEQVKKDKSIPIIIPPFKSPADKEILKVLKVLGLKTGYPIKLPEYNTYTQTDVPVGYMYFMKLEHIGSEKIHSRSTGPMTQKTGQPTAGKRREGGQRMGEMDTYSLASYNCPMLLAEFFGPLSDDSVTKTEIIKDIVQTGSAEYRTPKVSPGRDLLGAYFVALMLGGK